MSIFQINIFKNNDWLAKEFKFKNLKKKKRWTLSITNNYYYYYNTVIYYFEV